MLAQNYEIQKTVWKIGSDPLHSPSPSLHTRKDVLTFNECSNHLRSQTGKLDQKIEILSALILTNFLFSYLIASTSYPEFVAFKMLDLSWVRVHCFRQQNHRSQRRHWVADSIKWRGTKKQEGVYKFCAQIKRWEKVLQVRRLFSLPNKDNRQENENFVLPLSKKSWVNAFT